MESKTLTIQITGRDPDRVVVADAIKLLQSTMTVLEELERTRGSSTDSTRWVIVAASMRSPLSFTLEAEAKLEEATVQASQPFVRLLREIDEGKRPQTTSDRMIQSIDRIGRLLLNGVADVSFIVPGEEPYHPSEKFTEMTSRLRETHPRHYWTRTVLEGTLERIDVHGRAEFFIYDRLNADPIRCFFEPADAESLGSLITRRIRVTGEVKFTREHRPISMKVHQFEAVAQEQPRLTDLHAKHINITGGKDSVRFIRGLRNG